MTIYFLFLRSKPISMIMGRYHFNAPASLWLMPGVTSVLVDFGDGAGYQSLTTSSTITVNYSHSGTFVLTAQITTTAGTFLAKSSINYNPPNLYWRIDTSFNVGADPVYANVDSYIAAHSGIRSARKMGFGDNDDPCQSPGSLTNRANCDIGPGAVVEFQYGCDNYFDKPIIFVEGFDPLGSVKPENLSAYLTKNYGTDLSFFTNLRDQGYDFVYVTFTKNTDFIENNAQVLKIVLDKVNYLKHGTAKNTVIGFSMGGLIARWTLRTMENNSQDHQVANFFSFDSPQQGANVSFGLQCLYNQLKADFPWLSTSSDFTDLGEGFQSAAAQEMLVLNANSVDGTPIVPLRNMFAHDLINLGYPQTCTNHGISLGRGENPTSTVSSGVGNQFSFSGGTNIFHGSLTFLLENMSADVFAESNNTNARVLHYTYEGIKPVRLFNINIASVFKGQVTDFYLGAVPSYDDVPGSYENTQSQFVFNYNGNFYPTHIHQRGLAGLATNNGHYGHCFVPLASALDLQNQNYGVSGIYLSTNMYYAIDNDIQNPGQVSGNTTSTSGLPLFDNVHTSTSDCGPSGTCAVYTGADDYRTLGSIPDPKTGSWNDYHEGPLSSQATLYLARKILNATPTGLCGTGPDFCAESIAIHGSTSLCDNSTTTYSIGTRLSNVAIQWSFPYGLLQIVSGQGTPSIVVKSTPAGTGTETVTALLTNSCGQSAYYYFGVAVGGSIPNISITGIAPYANGPMDVSISNTITTPYKWYVDNALVATSYSSTATINGGSCGYHNFKPHRLLQRLTTVPWETG